MEYRRATPQDLPLILELQEKNLSWNLTEAERAGGFLSTAFTLEQFEEMNRSVGVVICTDGEKILGYICASTPEFNRPIPYPGALVEYCSVLMHDGRSVNSYHYCLINPVCIDRAHQGGEIYTRLLSKILEIATLQFEMAVGFISDKNSRHINAIQKMGHQFSGQFTKNEQTFLVITKALAPNATYAIMTKQNA